MCTNSFTCVLKTMLMMREGEGEGKEKGGGGDGDCLLWRSHLYTKTRTEYSPLGFRILEAWIVTWYYHSCLTWSHGCPGHPHQTVLLMEDTKDKIHRKVHLISAEEEFDTQF